MGNATNKLFGFIKWVDKGWITNMKDLVSWRFEHYPFVRATQYHSFFRNYKIHLMKQIGRPQWIQIFGDSGTRPRKRRGDECQREYKRTMTMAPKSKWNGTNQIQAIIINMWARLSWNMELVSSNRQTKSWEFGKERLEKSCPCLEHLKPTFEENLIHSSKAILLAYLKLA